MFFQNNKFDIVDVNVKETSRHCASPLGVSSHPRSVRRKATVQARSGDSEVEVEVIHFAECQTSNTPLPGQLYR